MSGHSTSPTLAVDESILRDYVGRYVGIDEPGISVLVSLQDGRLMIDEGDGPLRMYPQSITHFLAPDELLDITFIPGSDGTPSTKLRWYIEVNILKRVN